MPPTATSQQQHNPGLVPEPHHTSARWHSLSPGSLHRSTTSLHIVSGVTGTSVKCCSLSLRYTVRNICQQTERERDSSCQCPHHRFHFLVTWDSFPRAPVESGAAVWPSVSGACRAPGVLGVRANQFTQMAKLSLALTLYLLFVRQILT